MRTKLRSEEKVIYDTMKHWFSLSPPVFAFIGVLFLFFALPSGASYAGIKKIIGWGILASLIYLIYAYYERKYNIWIVTNMRVIDEWGVLSHNIKESPLEKINNASCRQSLTGRIFGFGDILIQTAAESGATVFSFVENPKELNEAITTARSDYMQRGGVEMSFERTVNTTDMRKCDFCAELIKKEAKVCRFCERDVVQAVSELKPEQPASGVTAPIASEPDTKPKEGFNPRAGWSK